MKFAITKCHGSGNDFPMIDARGMTIPDGEPDGGPDAGWARIARVLADRTGPVGGDGLLLMTDGTEERPIGFRMFNVDGSEAETCLNGLRCVARLGFERLGIAQGGVQLNGSTAWVERDADLAPGVYTVSERAGPASLDAAAWPLGDLSRVVEQVVPMLESERRFTAVAIPNPHLVAFVDAIDDAELSAIGRRCEAAPAWLPRRANVSFVMVRDDSLFVRTFERGVGLTNSCGSAMAASTYAAGLTGRIGWDTVVTVFNRGGLVRAIANEDAMVTLSGNATVEWTGEVTIGEDDACALTVHARHDDEIAAWDGVLTMAAAWR